MSNKHERQASRWDRSEAPGARRPYANVAADQQPTVAADEGYPGWFGAALVAIIPAILVAVYLGTQQTEVTIPGQFGDTDRTVGPTTQDVWAAGVGTFVGFVVTMRALFALLNIEQALRRR